jgi:hypothetical protein
VCYWRRRSNGDLKAVELVWNRIEGKALDRQEHGQPGEFQGLREIPDEVLRHMLAAAVEDATTG